MLRTYRLPPIAYRLQARIDRLALERQDPEDTLVDAAQRLAADEALERLDPEGKLPDGQGALRAEAALAEALQVLLGSVLRAVDDAEVLAAPALHRGLHDPPLAAGDEGERLHHHPFPAAGRQILPPAHGC